MISMQKSLPARVWPHSSMTIGIWEPAKAIHDLKSIQPHRCETTGTPLPTPRLRPEIRPDRIGVWGTSYTGGLVLMVAALDRRVKCVVSQVPFISGYETMIQVMPVEERKQFHDTVQKERLSLAAGNPPSLVAVCANDTSKPIDAPGRRTYSYFQSCMQQNSLNWENKVTLRSLDLRLEYEAMPFVARVSPTPLLMIIADNDTITPTDIALRAFEQALEPKKIVLLQGDHYVPYREAFDRSSGVARDWLAQYLL